MRDRKYGKQTVNVGQMFAVHLSLFIARLTDLARCDCYGGHRRIKSVSMSPCRAVAAAAVDDRL